MHCQHIDNQFATLNRVNHTIIGGDNMTNGGSYRCQSRQCPRGVGCSARTCVNGGGAQSERGNHNATHRRRRGEIAPVRRRRGGSAPRLAGHRGLRNIGVRRGANPAVARSSGPSMESTRVEGGRGKKIRWRQ